MALTGHSGMHTAQSMHSSGSMVRKLGPSRKQSTGHTSTQAVYLQAIQASVTTWVMVFLWWYRWKPPILKFRLAVCLSQGLDVDLVHDAADLGLDPAVAVQRPVDTPWHQGLVVQPGHGGREL